MKKLGILLIMIIVLTLTACKSGTIETSEVEARVIEVDIENESLLVEGIGGDNPLGDLSMVNIKGAEISKLGEAAELSDIEVGDRVALQVKEVAESYPSQAESKKVEILEKGKD